MPAQSCILGETFHGRVLILPDGPNHFMLIVRTSMDEGLWSFPRVSLSSFRPTHLRMGEVKVDIEQARGRKCSINDDETDGYLVTVETVDGTHKRAFTYDRREGFGSERLTWMRPGLLDTWRPFSALQTAR